ncbi:MAG TPA: alpha-L-glutamate ligase-like protein [Gammaproteobacteria bacterium]|nr:alpha-L-glutamate ligase-like protein [Gammaproteobacteria bacterium]
MFDRIRKLREAGVLGINRRNADYTLVYNPRRLYPLVDDKLQTKRLALEAGMAVPELYGVISHEYEIKRLPEMLAPHASFVVKPAHGSGGNGIVVITGRMRKMYRKAGGLLLSPDELAYHVSNTLSGLYSLGGYPDQAIIEYRVQFDPVFEAISYQGVPDIRIIVFLGVPVLAMVRLPTRASEGKANLHQGALGVGVDIATGRTLTAVWGNDTIDEHPDTGNPVNDVAVPGWDDLLRLASRCCELTALGYQGVDIVLDRERGPLILEINARPGLNIQIANRTGLLHRLHAVERHHRELRDVEARVAFAKAHFSHGDRVPAAPA